MISAKPISQFPIDDAANRRETSSTERDRIDERKSLRFGARQREKPGANLFMKLDFFALEAIFLARAPSSDWTPQQCEPNQARRDNPVETSNHGFTPLGEIVQLRNSSRSMTPAITLISQRGIRKAVAQHDLAGADAPGESFPAHAAPGPPGRGTIRSTTRSAAHRLPEEPCESFPSAVPPGSRVNARAAACSRDSSPGRGFGWFCRCRHRPRR